MICNSLLRHAPGRHLSVYHGPMNAVSRPKARAGLICKAGSSDVTIGRRQQLIASLVAYPVGQLLFEPAAAHADVEPAVRQYVDPQDSFQVAVPSGWLEEETKLDGNSSFTGSSGARRTMIWYSPDMPASEVNVTLTITNTSAEFTRLGSFGNVYTFGQNLVNSMDQRFLLRVRGNQGSEPVQIARLEDALETKGMYYVDYTIEKVPGPKRHLYSVVALAFNGRYNRLYTMTAQCLEDQVPQVAPVLKQVLGSFVPPAGTA